MKFRTLVITSFITLAHLSNAQSMMTVYQQDKKVGTAKYYLKKTSKGIESYFALSVTGAAGKVNFIARGSHNKKGFPIRESYRQFSPSGDRSTVLTFSPTSITIQTEADGRKATKKQPIAKNINLATPSVYWFVNTTPKVGKLESSDEFDAERLTFKVRTVQYVGKETLVIRGKRLSLHKVKHSDDTFWLDSKGLPVQIELGGLLMVRN
jgi:hypothetical protein